MATKLKAWSLIEILIAMTIFAVAIIGITSLNAKNFLVIKRNEQQDQASRVMISVLEFFKSPTKESQTTIINKLGSTAPGVPIHLIVNTNDSNYSDIFVDTPFNWKEAAWTSGALVDCTASTANGRIGFKSSGFSDGFHICLQTDIQKQSYGYLITVKMLYLDSANALVTKSLIGYRPFTYVDLP